MTVQLKQIKHSHSRVLRIFVLDPILYASRNFQKDPIVCKYEERKTKLSEKKCALENLTTDFVIGPIDSGLSLLFLF